jgi:hypothetical protein
MDPYNTEPDVLCQDWSLGTVGGINTNLKLDWLAVILPQIWADFGVTDVREAPKYVFLVIRQSVWIHQRLILMCYVKISPLGLWVASTST